MPEIVAPLDRQRTSVEQALVDAVRDHANYEFVAVIGYDFNGDVAYTNSGLSKEAFVCLLMDVLDAVRR